MLLGIVGEVKSSVRKSLKLPAYAAAFELDMQLLELSRQQINSQAYIPLPRYPSVTQDISLKVPADTPFQIVYDMAWSCLEGREQDDLRFTLKPLDIYQRENDTDHKQIALRLTVASYQKTLTDSEVSVFMDKIAQVSHDELGAERI